jgi:PAS domain S-box-containing protein
MYTVLYVDDEQDLLDLARLYLEKSPEFCVTTRASAQEALDSPLITTCDVIVSDYQMPGTDGIAFLKAVRERYGEIPFILFTGRGREDVVIEAINNGADFYLQKGGDPKSQFAELAHKIHMAVERKRAMDARQESETRFATFFNASPINQMITDYSTARVIDVNDRLLKEIGLLRGDVVGKTLPESGFILDPAQRIKILEQLDREGTVRNAELNIRALDGRTWSTLTSMTRVKVHGQELVYIQSIDVTAQKKAQQIIDALLNAPPDASFMVDRNGIILTANHAASVRFSLPVQDLIGRDAFTLISPDLADLRRMKISEAITTRKPLVYLDNRTGRSYENHLYPVTGPEGDAIAVAILSRDVTEERQAKEALKESEEKYRLVVEHSHDSIYIYRDDHFLFVNQQAEEISGYSHKELMKRELWDFIHPEDRKRLKEAASRRFAGGHVSTTFNARILRKNGEVRDAEFFVDLVEYLGRPAILGIARDVTEKKKAEVALRESELRYRTILDTMQDAYFRADTSGRISMASPSAARMFGYDSVEDILGIPAVSLYASPEVRDEMLNDLKKEGKVVNGFGEGLRKDGTPISVSINVQYYRDDEGKILGTEGIVRNVSDQKVIWEALCESEARFRGLSEQSQDLIMLFDRDLRNIYVNPIVERIAGIRPVQWTGKTPGETGFEPEIAEPCERALREAFATGREGRIEMLLPSSDLWFDCLLVPVHGPDGTVTEVITSARDITDRKKAEEKLRRSEEDYRLIIENMQDVFYRTDREGIITMISSYGARIVGYDSPADIIGKMRATDFYADPVERDVFMGYLLKNKVVTGYPLTLKDKYGELHYATAGCRILYDPDGNVNGVEGILHDVTHLKQVEDALRQANRQIRLMTSITRHDIRNQLLALNGWLELSRESVDNPGRMLEMISQGQKIAGIIGQQINFTTIFDDMGVKPPAWQDPSALVRSTAATLPFNEVRLEIDLPGIVLFGDPLLEKIFYNLFDNALRYGGERMTFVRVFSRYDDTDFILVVEDNGTGIPAQDKEQLFDSGFGKNTGLGLFLVKEILAITGMTICETGIPTEGARFEIRVPAGRYRIAGTVLP